MRIVVAPDKFKNSLSSAAVCAAIAAGLRDVMPQAAITSLPLSDGGDGLAVVLQHYGSFKQVGVTVADPLGRPVVAGFLYDPAAGLAFVEMAQASGLHLLSPEEYDPSRTTTLGTGQLIAAAISAGARRIIIGIGGSATNDGGMGMAVALGFRFLDAAGAALPPCGASLGKVAAIDDRNSMPIDHIQFEVAADVTNTLTGPQGAAQVFAPQKGADAPMVQLLEQGMVHFATLLQQRLGSAVAALAGGGAAGGIGAGCVVFLNAKIRSGASLVLDYSKAAEHIRHADLVITGEGRLDASTFNGKVVHAVAGLCQQHAKPLIVLCGSLAVPPAKLRAEGIAAAFSIVNQPMTLDTAMAETARLLQQTASMVGGLLLLPATWQT